MRPNLRLICLLVFGLVLIFNVSAQAVPIFGTYNITGEVQLDTYHFDWLSLGGGGGYFLSGFSSTGTFYALLAGFPGFAKDLDLALLQPVGVPFLLNSYMIFPAYPNLSFDLNFIFPGADLGALTLTDIPNVGVNLTWGVRTTVLDQNTPGEEACYTGIYSSQVCGMTSSELLDLLTSGGSIASTYSASFSPSPCPLPATAPLFLTGLAGLNWHLTRRRQAQ